MTDSTAQKFFLSIRGTQVNRGYLWARLCRRGKITLVLCCPVMQHGWQFEKMHRLASWQEHVFGMHLVSHRQSTATWLQKVRLKKQTLCVSYSVDKSHKTYSQNDVNIPVILNLDGNLELWISIGVAWRSINMLCSANRKCGINKLIFSQEHFLKLTSKVLL